MGRFESLKRTLTARFQKKKKKITYCLFRKMYFFSKTVGRYQCDFSFDRTAAADTRIQRIRSTGHATKKCVKKKFF